MIFDIDLDIFEGSTRMPLQMLELKMATATRNPIKRRVWNEFSTRGYVIEQNPIPIGYGGYGCGCVLPIPAYPRVKNTRQNN